MRTISPSLLLFAIASTLVATPARAQDVICCNEIIGVDGDWFGAIRLDNCQEFLNRAPIPTLRRMCKYPLALVCVNASRCRQLPPDETATKDTPDVGTATLPPSPDSDGLADGFGNPQPAPAPPPVGGVSPPRLVFLIMGSPGEGKPASSFTVWLDHNACALPLDQNNRLANSAAARHVVRGRLMRRDGHVHIEAEAQQRPGGAKLGPFTAEAEGEDAAAVARATRAVTLKLKLVCGR